MYLDRHEGMDISPEDLAAAHVQDLEQEGALDVHYHTYWFDQDNGSVFCLAEGPTKEAIEEVHRRAHGAMPTSIIDLLAAPRTGENADHLCLVVEPMDFDAFAASGRFEIVDGPATRFGARGDGTSVYFRDPDANLVELRYY